MAKGRARIDIESRFDGKGTRDAEQALGRLHSVGSKSLTGLKVAGLAAGGAIGIGLAAAVATGTREMLEQEQVSAQTAARLKSTGEAAKVTQRQIEDMAGALQAQTGVADDQIQAMQNLLLTFTNVRNEAGKGNDVFNQTTKATLDLSVAFGKDLNSSAILVGKALNDPIRGLAALSRVGVQFTKDQKEQIRTLVESGRVMDAQKVILRELARETGGSAKAAGDTTLGQLERIKRAWEDTSEALTSAFLPLFSKLSQAVLTKMPQIQRAFAWLGRKIEQGRWGEIGETVGRLLVEGIQAGINAGVLALRDSLPGGRNGVLSQAIFGDITHFTAAQLGLGVRPGTTNPLTGETFVPEPDRRQGRPRGGPGGGLAAGGFIPGRFDGRDDIPVNLSRGEVVLNPTQQEIVGINRIVGALRRTGGVVGGSGFASGGVVGGAVASAASFARAQVGEPYVWGAGHSYGDSRGWDCSGFASNVAARVPGYTGGIGTTMTLYPKAKAEGPAGANYPIAFGFNGMNINDPRRQHMGVRVNGVWYDAGSGGVEMGRASWDSGVWIPPGLGGLSGGGGPDPGPGVAPDRPTPLIGRKAIAAIISAGLGGPRAFTPGEALDAAVSARHRDDSLQDKLARSRGEGSARGAGVTNPDKIAAAGEQQVNSTRIAELRMDIADTKAAAGRVWTQITRLRGQLKRLYRALRRARRRQDQQRFIDAIRTVRESIADRWADYNGLVVQAADLEAEAKELDYDIGQLAAEIAGMPDATPTGDTGDAGGVTPDQQAQVDQANARAAAAQANAAGSEAFLKTLRESASIDAGAGGRPIFINVEGSLVRYGELANFVVGALAGQGAATPGAFVSAT